MAVRIFEDDEMIAREWLKKSIAKYHEGNAKVIKPREHNFVAGQSQFLTGVYKPDTVNVPDSVTTAPLTSIKRSDSPNKLSKLGRLKRTVKSLSPLGSTKRKKGKVEKSKKKTA